MVFMNYCIFLNKMLHCAKELRCNMWLTVTSIFNLKLQMIKLTVLWQVLNTLSTFHTCFLVRKKLHQVFLLGYKYGFFTLYKLICTYKIACHQGATGACYNVWQFPLVGYRICVVKVSWLLGRTRVSKRQTKESERNNRS